MSDHLIAEANRHARALIIERDQLRTELALLREWQREVIQNANAHHAERREAIARAESAEREAFDWKKIARYETARAERAEASLHALRLVCGTTDADKFTTWVDRANARADEAEHDCRVLIVQLNAAEAELKEWSLLNLWGGTPEIIHGFIKGQQARIHAAQDVEGELESTKERALTLANSLDQAQTELAELKESVLVQQIFSDDRIRANAAEAELKAEQDIRVINEIELKVSRAIVSKIWVQLGSPTYEQLKGRSIYDLIDELKAELAKERARLDWLMAGGVCMVQHTGGFHVSRLHAPVSRAAIDAAMKEGAK